MRLVSGVVRDTQGVAQMGAMVEVLAAGSVSVATAFTDMYGRYRIANLVPGKYQVRATAALFVPATRTESAAFDGDAGDRKSDVEHAGGPGGLAAGGAAQAG
jgi:hypothetical protein